MQQPRSAHSSPKGSIVRGGRRGQVNAIPRGREQTLGALYTDGDVGVSYCQQSVWLPHWSTLLSTPLNCLKWRNKDDPNTLRSEPPNACQVFSSAKITVSSQFIIGHFLSSFIQGGKIYNNSFSFVIESPPSHSTVNLNAMMGFHL